MQENRIQENTNSYLLNMRDIIQENQNKENANIDEYGEQNLREILLHMITTEYINLYKNNNIGLQQKSK